MASNKSSYRREIHKHFSLCRFHLIGLLVLCLYDIGDVILEVSKTLVYFKDRGDKNHPILELVTNIGFAIFTAQQ